MRILKVLLLATVLFSFACSKDEVKGTNRLDETPPEQSVAFNKKLNAVDFNDKIKNENVQLIDVRRPEEYAEAHIKNASNINFYDADFIEKMTQNLDKSKPVYLYCRSGGRSGKAAAQLSELGFKVYDLEGGILDWKSKELELVKE